MEHQCIRVFADATQISRGREKINEWEPQIQTLSSALSLIGNEVRLKILFLLQEEEQLCVCDLSDILSMKVPAVSQHLRKLKDGGIVYTHRVGSTIYYAITNDVQPLVTQVLKFVAQTATVKS